MLINKRENATFIYDSIAFIEYWNDMDDIYKKIEEYSQNKKIKILIVFCDIITGMQQKNK